MSVRNFHVLENRSSDDGDDALERRGGTLLPLLLTILSHLKFDPFSVPPLLSFSYTLNPPPLHSSQALEAAVRHDNKCVIDALVEIQAEDALSSRPEDQEIIFHLIKVLLSIYFNSLASVMHTIRRFLFLSYQRSLLVVLQK